LSILRFFP